MDRNMVYPGAIPLDTDVLTVQRSIMKALGFIAQAALGTSAIFDGLACTQQTVPNMTVQVGPGSALSLQVVDANTFGSLAADASPLMKLGINTGPTTLSTPAPGTTGQSINYLIEASYQETDATSVVLPYYNSANPAVPFSGPANSGAPQNTQRLQTVSLIAKAGTPAATGTQTTPAADSGYAGLYVVTVAFGASSVINANISTLAPAPFVPVKLGPGMVPGFSNMQSFKTTANFTVPAGITKIFAYAVGGGGASGGVGTGTAASGGGSGGTYGEGVYTVTPGQVITVTIGAGGVGGAGTGGNGGVTSVGSLLSCPGGLGAVGVASGVGAGAASPAAATGAALSIQGYAGPSAGSIGGQLVGGVGGASFLGQGGYSGGAAQSQSPGGAGGGVAVVSSSANGVGGSAGLAVIRW